MAKQLGLFKFTGKLGNLVGYKLNGKYITRTIGKVDKAKMQTAPQYAATRHNQSLFAKASKAGQLFRQSLLHLTKGFTAPDYASTVVSIMLKALKVDTSHTNGQPTIHNGLKTKEVQLAFQKLLIYRKYSCKHYSSQLVTPTAEPNKYRLDHNILFHKSATSEQKQVSLAYLHIDFEASIAKYEPILTIHTTHNKDQKYSTLSLPSTHTAKTPYTFLIVQVHNSIDGQVYNELEYISIVDVTDNTIRQPLQSPHSTLKVRHSSHIMLLQDTCELNTKSFAIRYKYGDYSLPKNRKRHKHISEIT